MNPEFIILYPALGLPAIVTNGKIDVILLVNKSSSLLQLGTTGEINNPSNSSFMKNFLSVHLSYTKWKKSVQELLYSSIKETNCIDASDLSEMQWISVDGNGRLLFDDDCQELDLVASKQAMNKFESEFEISKVLHFRLDFKSSQLTPGLYALWNQNDYDEGEAIRTVLRNLTDPASKENTLNDEDRATRTIGFTLHEKYQVRPLHPFFLPTEKETLVFAQVTDTHVSTHWELFERRLRESYHGVDASLSRDFNNYNKNFLTILQRACEDDNTDLVFLTGDLIDYNKGHKIDFSSDKSIEIYEDNGKIKKEDYDLNRNWVFFYELLLSQYVKPVFTILGNHDYLLNPHEAIINVGVMRGLLKHHQLGFIEDLNLVEREGSEITEHSDFELNLFTALELEKAINSRDEKELGTLIRTRSPDLIFSPESPEFSCEEATTWYHLVINPFSSYSFDYHKISFMLLDWGRGSQPGSVLLSPRPAGSDSKLQIEMIKRWIERKEGVQISRVLLTHAPLLAPWPEIGDYYLRKGWIKKKLESNFLERAKTSSKELSWGVLEDDLRQTLLEIISRGKNSPIHIALSGHNHTNKTFQLIGEQVYLRHEGNMQRWDTNYPLLISTTSSGPFGRYSESSEWKLLLEPGYRTIRLGADGRFESEKRQTTFLERKPRALVLDELNHHVHIQNNSLVGKNSLIVNSFIDRVREDLELEGVGDRVLVIGRIEKNSRMRVTGDHGTVIALYNDGNLEIEGNVRRIVVEANSKNGLVEIVKKNSGILSGHESIFFRRNFGEIKLESTESKTVIVSNQGKLLVEENRHEILIGKNKGEIFVRSNSGKVSLRANQGVIEIGNGRHGMIDIKDNTLGTLTLKKNDGDLLLPVDQLKRGTVK